MQILKQEKNGNTVNLEIEVEAKAFEKAIEEAYVEVSKEVKMPGFRKGKTPRSVLEGQIKKEAIIERAVGIAAAHAYPKIIEETKIEPLDYPKIEVLRVAEGQPLAFKVAVEVRPEVKLGKYKKIKVKKIKDEVEDKEIDDFIEKLRDGEAVYVKVEDRPVKENDLVEMDVQAKVGEKDIKELTMPQARMIVGKENIPGIDKQLLGVKNGESKNFSLEMPKDFSIAEAATKRVDFKIDVKSISEKDFPPLDNEFAKKVGGFESVEKLREEVKRGMTARKKNEAQAKVREELVEKVAEDSKVDVPEVLVGREIDMMVEDMKRYLEGSKVPLEEYLKMSKKTLEDLRKEYRNSATKRAKAKLVLETIAREENIEISPDELNEEIKAMSKELKKSGEELRRTMGEGVRYLTEYLKRQKAVDFLLENANIK